MLKAKIHRATITGANVDYISGSGSDTITFSYTVGPGENSADLNYNNPKISKYSKFMHVENIFNYISFF